MFFPSKASEPVSDASSEPDWSQLWFLDPAITFLNHGSFGACPKAVLAVQQELRLRLEQEPVRFFVRDLGDLLAEARQALAEFIGADPEALTFVPNATTGVNTVLRSLRFEPGDELLVTNHEYNACCNALNFVAAQTGAQVVVASIPFPLESSEQVVAAVLSQVSARTKLALLDHITSQTGLILPLEQLVKALTERGVETLVDGAHAPGMVPLNLQSLGATYYTGNCHKWLCAPKGAAFLFVQPERQAEIHPLAISHGANFPLLDRSRFRLEFDWTGTTDPTSYLCVPEAIRFMGALLPGGWPQLMVQNRAKVLAARRLLSDALSIPLPCPDEMIGSLATLPLPDGSTELPKPPLYLDPLQEALMDSFGIEVPVISWPARPKRLLRISAQLYNTPAQYQLLAKALAGLLASA
ncbi:aminotransferase class V-fold PLP-dependent enzyme [Leptolyngbya sp. FACHB-261]|uniref:aminotransferase class V-fold PLP-dependent enzyme n=1 Tax=Leptolyngbya sp. FACHB-261 TaxID=2692806 RepID=UPI001684796E|nr:aminotransferase class V-fold PLP-dependent enzyme [Leptolyngbya sp. FACHB-261]MBD2103297.1 aminotransferase class V-fold PLP-dependent enzyme [Leptolyngbya sp. FACHB-261]